MVATKYAATGHRGCVAQGGRGRRPRGSPSSHGLPGRLPGAPRAKRASAAARREREPGRPSRSRSRRRRRCRSCWRRRRGPGRGSCSASTRPVTTVSVTRSTGSGPCPLAAHGHHAARSRSRRALTGQPDPATPRSRPTHRDRLRQPHASRSGALAQIVDCGDVIGAVSSWRPPARDGHGRPGAAGSGQPARPRDRCPSTRVPPRIPPRGCPASIECTFCNS